MQEIHSDKQHLIVDRMGRRFRNLRLSLTAACNYACTYCVPDGKRLQAAAYEQWRRNGSRSAYSSRPRASTKYVLPAANRCCRQSLRTLQGIMALGLTDVSDDSGQLLPLAPAIIDSGMKRINVSLDTLDRERFRDIARSGDLNTVLHGIELMQAGGLKVKINMVPMNHVNDDQILPMLDYALEQGIELRFMNL